MGEYNYKFDGLLSLVKEYIIDLWEIQNINVTVYAKRYHKSVNAISR